MSLDPHQTRRARSALLALPVGLAMVLVWWLAR
jgi:hypothetical protein